MLLLSDRAVEYARAVIINGLAAKLTQVDAEFSISSATPAPSAADVVATRFGEFIPDSVSVEVFEGLITFPNIAGNFHTWFDTNSARVVDSEITVGVRLTHTNRTMLTVEQMLQRSRRYLIALVRLFRDKADPTSVDSSILSIKPVNCDILQEDLTVNDGTRRSVDRVMLILKFALNEQAVSEGSAGVAVGLSWRI